MLFAAAALSVAAACTKQPGQGGDGPVPPVENPRFPIVAWAGIDAADAASKFPPMKEAGFNIYLDWYDSFDDVDKALDAAEASGIKLIVRSNELLSNPALEAGKLKNRDGFYGYFIDDEPEVTEFDTIKDIVSRIRKVDDAHPCYVNLYPNWAWGGEANYLSRVNAFVNKVHPDFLSFDFYPILEKDGITFLRPGWYKNLEDIRKVSRAKGIPFWAFALSLSCSGDVKNPVPVLSHLRLQQFVNLAYGAQGFQYWTYWGIYHNSPTSVYSIARQVNEELQVLARYFYGADVTDVWHTGGEIPEGTRELDSMPYGVNSFTAGGPVLLSQFSNNGCRYLAVVNKDFEKSVSLSVVFSGKALKFDHKGFKTEVANTDMKLPGGDICVFQIQ